MSAEASRLLRPTAAEIAALRALIEGASALPSPDVPFAAPLVLFSRLDAPTRAALFAPRPGRVLIQEMLSIDAERPLAPDREFRSDTRLTRPADGGGPIVVEARIATPEGEPIAAMKAGLGVVEATALARSTGLPPGRADAAASLRRALPPISEASVARWLSLVGDDNPIHTDDALAAALGLAAPIVPGALVAALIEPVIVITGWAVRRLSMRFVAPIPVGTEISVAMVERGLAPDGARVLRVFVALADGRIAAVGDVSAAASRSNCG